LMGTGNLQFGLRCSTDGSKSTYYGKTGKIVITSSASQPTTKCTISAGGKVEEVDFNFPRENEAVRESGGFYDNSAGFVYQCAAIARCVGRLETPQNSWKDVVMGLGIIEKIREGCHLDSWVDKEGAESVGGEETKGGEEGEEKEGDGDEAKGGEGAEETKVETVPGDP
jgi:hypothetical protein